MMYVRLLDTTAIKECDEGALVINTETGKNCYVNKTGLSFLRALDGTTQNTDTVISTLITQFDMISENELSHDFYEFFSEMKGKGIVVMSENIADVEKYTLTSMLVELTMKCNERCVHCYIPNSQKNEAPTMSFKMFCKLIDEFVELGGREITLSGGEPLMHKSIKQILHYCHEKGLTINLFSNLLLLSDSFVDIFKHIRIGYIQTSVYSLSPAIHDSITKIKGSLEKTLNSIEHLLDEKIRVQISCPVFKMNKESIKSVIDYAKRKDIRLRTNAALLPQLNGDDSFVVDNALTSEEWRYVLCNLTESEPVYMRDYVLEYNNNSSELFQNPKKFLDSCICDAGISCCAVSPTGDVYPCPEWLSYHLGNINEQSLTNIWNKSSAIRLLRRINQQKNYKMCLECNSIDFCKRCFAYYEQDNKGELLRISNKNCEDAYTTKLIFDKYYHNND